MAEPFRDLESHVDACFGGYHSRSSGTGRRSYEARGTGGLGQDEATSTLIRVHSTEDAGVAAQSRRGKRAYGREPVPLPTASPALSSGSPTAPNSVLRDRRTPPTAWSGTGPTSSPSTTSPKEHWIHLRTSNPIESIFGGVRLGTDATKRMWVRDNVLYLVFKLAFRLSTNWRNHCPQPARPAPGRTLLRGWPTPTCPTIIGGDCRLTGFSWRNLHNSWPELPE
jgi:hypothetical protein